MTSQSQLTVQVYFALLAKLGVKYYFCNDRCIASRVSFHFGCFGLRGLPIIHFPATYIFLFFPLIATRYPLSPLIVTAWSRPRLPTYLSSRHNIRFILGQLWICRNDFTWPPFLFNSLLSRLPMRQKQSLGSASRIIRFHKIPIDTSKVSGWVMIHTIPICFALFL